MAKILTPATQGAQNIGSIKSEAANTPFQSFQTNADMFGGGQAKSLLQAGEALQSGADFLTKQAEERSLLNKMNAETAAVQFESEQSRNLAQKKLSGAANAEQEYNDAAEEFYSSQDVSGLNEKDSVMYRHFVTRSRNNGRSAALKQQIIETDKNLVATAENRAAMYSSKAQAQYNNGVVYRDSVDAIKSSEALVGQKTGRDPDVTKQIIKDQISAMNIGRIKMSLSLGDTATATAIFENGKRTGEIDGDDYSAITEMIAKDSRAKTAQLFTDNLLLTETSEAAALAKVRSSFSGEDEVAVLKEVKLRFAEKERLRKRAEEERFDFVSKKAADPGSPRLTEVELHDLSEREKKYVKAVEQDKILRAADPDYDRKGDGGETWKKWHDDSSDWEKVGKMTRRELEIAYELGVTKKQFEETIVREWRGYQQALGKKAEAEDMSATGASGMTELQRVAASFEVSTKLKKKDSPEAFTAFQVEYDERVRQADARKPDEKARILDEMVKEKIIWDKSDVWLGSDAEQNVSVLTEEQRLTFAKDADIPSSQRQAFSDNLANIVDDLRASKAKISRANILTLFKNNPHRYK